MSTFKAEDINDAAKLKKLLDEITADPSLIDRLPESELQRIEKLASPYGTILEKPDKDTYTCLSFTNLRQEYIKKLLTTAMIGYLYRRCDEYGREYKDTVDYMDDMKSAEQQVIENQQQLTVVERDIIDAIRVRDELAAAVERDKVVNQQNLETYAATRLRMTKEEIHEMRHFSNDLAKSVDDLRLANKKIDELESRRAALQGFGKRFIIREFLDAQFRFNPDKHVRSSYVSQTTPSKETTYMTKFVPPDDFFHNFQYYVDSNYEELRGVAEHLYRMKPDLDVGIIPYAEFQTPEEADAFVDRNKDATIASILTLKNGMWNFLESFKANRDRIEAYRGTIVEDILQQVKSDTKIGAELTRNRAVARRRENVRNLGPDPGKVREYMSQNVPCDASAVVGGDVPEEEQKRLYEEHQEKKRADEAALLSAAAREEPAPHDTLRVNVYKFSAGGSETEKSHFFTKAVAPDPNALPIVRH